MCFPKIESAAVEGIASTASDDVDLPASGLAVLRTVGVAENLELLLSAFFEQYYTARVL